MNTQQALARKKNNLQVPMIIRDHLVTKVPMNSDVEYGLHEILSNLAPEDALLCAAFSIEEIAINENITSTEMTFLGEECTNIITHYMQENSEETSAKDMMLTLAENMEDFLDTVAMCHMSFDITNEKAAKFIDILMTQLQAHLIIVDEVISMMDEEKETAEIPAHIAQNYSGDNIIQFPIKN